MTTRLRVGIAFAGVVALCLVSPVRVDGQPIGVQVSPRVAPTNTNITVSGSGCTSQVHVVATAFLFPGSPTVPLDTLVMPISTGSWTTTFPMPNAPAYVLATCDGMQSSPPIVISPNDVDTGAMSYFTFTPAYVEIVTSPLENGSEFAVFDEVGNLLDSAIAEFGIGTVRVPRTLGPATVRAIGLRAQDSGISLPYVPFSRTIQLPLASAPSIVVAPRVATSGSPLVATGNCVGTPRLIVTGRPAGWYDVPPVFVDADQATDANSNWTATFPMPVIPSRVTVRCTNGGVTEVVEALVSPSAGDIVQLTAEPSDTGTTIVTIPKPAPFGPFEAFTPTGVSVPLVILNASTMRVELSSVGNPGRVIIVGFENLGENANARQVTRVQGWFVEVPARPVPINGGIPIDGLLPAQRIDLLGLAGNCCPQPAVRSRI